LVLGSTLDDQLGRLPVWTQFLRSALAALELKPPATACLLRFPEGKGASAARTELYERAHRVFASAHAGHDPIAQDKKRRIGAHEGWCYHHVQAIIVAIDQSAEAATGNRELFWNGPQSIGGNRKSGDIP
jgi:hypothetical protein